MQEKERMSLSNAEFRGLSSGMLVIPFGCSLKVLVACEFSGIVREAFKAKGHDAWSCDLLPTEIPGQHIQGDVLEIINNGWDMMIAHPPCTYLSYAGMRNWYDEGRAMKRIKAAEFFMKMYDAPIKHICVENPRGIMSKIFREPDMVIHPYYFGEREMKRTNLWLKNLPVLEYHLEDNLFGIKTATDKPEPVNVQLRKTGRIKKRYFTDGISNGKLKTEHEKSKSFQSISNAMAKQWG